MLSAVKGVASLADVVVVVVAAVITSTLEFMGNSLCDMDMLIAPASTHIHAHKVARLTVVLQSS